MTSTRMDIAAKSDPGCVRQKNEDSLAVDEKLGLFVVADGMGGHNSGEVASHMAAEIILDLARKTLKQDATAPERTRHLEDFVRTANDRIHEKSLLFPQNQGMGTTVVACLADGRTAAVAHVGDSRLYAWRGSKLLAWTQDHSLVMDQVRRGLITPEEAETSSMRNVLTRALGTQGKIIVDVQERQMLPGDTLLLCTDGLTKMVQEPEIARILSQSSDALNACDRLIEASRAAGGIDNITVIIARFPSQKPRGLKTLFRRFLANGA